MKLDKSSGYLPKLQTFLLRRNLFTASMDRVTLNNNVFNVKWACGVYDKLKMLSYPLMFFLPDNVDSNLSSEIHVHYSFDLVKTPNLFLCQAILCSFAFIYTALSTKTASKQIRFKNS